MTLGISRFTGNAISDELAAAVRRVRLIAFDFDGVFTDNTVYVFEDGREAVRCCRADGLGLARLKARNIESIIISAEVNSVVLMRGRKLGVECFTGCDDKRATLQARLKERGLDASQAAFVGNDVNDLVCLKAVGLPIVVQDAHPDVVPYGLYRTAHKGGDGAVREICDLFETVLATSRGGVHG